ncbi:SSU processome component Utp10 [Aulographum hederae CBS 113979]|uniref:U3 small nucleolar RNA-associated protein 10 n=1 Tax=Aulographum hederae CBS 113979 TaxID=1176131 RepID=A0A6G1GKZ7_9PEZI|nr:SSU processome component Utp10 [Aulographum hederae CBS 113979]
MTSLQRQLAAIAAHSTHELDLRAQKSAHAKSLLFEPRVAASQDFNTIYHLCYEGFRELCLLDARFTLFARNLFSEQSKNEDRTQMTAQENKSLDEVIESFLGLVGARVLLKPGQKAIEWLIRRFRVHEYNTECLLLTFLTYHTHPLFATVLSILPKQLSQTYRFLYPHITSLSCPPRHTIVQAAAINPQFFSAFSQYTLKVAKDGHHYQGLLSFWASVATEGVNLMLDAARSGRGNLQNQREEDVLLRVLPILNDGFSVTACPELPIGLYMIILVVAMKMDLEEKVSSGLMDAVAGSLTAVTMKEGLRCLGLLARFRKNKRLPHRTRRRLLAIEKLEEHLVDVSSQQKASRLVLGCILAKMDRFVKSKDSASLDFIEKIIPTQVLDPTNLSAALLALLSLVDRLEEFPDFDQTARDTLADLIVRLYRSDSVGQAIQEVINKHELDVDSLEMKLKAVIRPDAPSLPNDDHGDVAMIDAKPVKPTMDNLFAELPSRTTEISFLQLHDEKLFQDLSHAFLQASQNEKGCSKFANLPVLRREQAHDDPLFLSFFVRIWSSPFPALARSAALRIVAQVLSDNDQFRVDLQPLIPYMVVALADPSVNVRRSASDAIKALTQVFGTSDELNSKSDSASWSTPNEFRDSEVVRLTQSQVSKLFSALFTPRLEEFVLDASQISKGLVMVLNSDSVQDQSKPKSNHVELKSSLRSATYSFFCANLLSMAWAPRFCLLKMLNRVGKAGSGGRGTHLIAGLRSWTAMSIEQISGICQENKLNLSDMNQEYFRIITSREQNSVDFLMKTIEGERGPNRTDIGLASLDRLRSIWPSVKQPNQLPLALAVFKLSRGDSGTAYSKEVQHSASETLRSVKLPTEALVSFLDDLPHATRLSDRGPATKKRRTSSGKVAQYNNQDAQELMAALQHYSIVMELIEASTPAKHPALLKGLFIALGELLQFKSQTEANLVYVLRMVLTCLYDIVENLKDSPHSKLDPSVVRIDLPVNCVRDTSSPQIRNAALLLISSLATWIPDMVLQSVMPIFTFMSSTILRQRDNYSAHVIDQTIAKIVPLLAASLRKQGKRDIVQGASELILSFVAAFEHTPLHRRLHLFEHLAKALGADDCLFAMVATLFDRYPTDSKLLPFTSELLEIFGPGSTITAFVKYVDLVLDVMKQSNRLWADALFNVDEKDAAEVSITVSNLLDGLSQLLRDKNLRRILASSVKTADETGDNVPSAQRSAFSTLIERIITMTNEIISYHENLHDECQGVLAAVFRLLPTVEVLKSTETLIESNDTPFQVRRALLKAISLQIQRTKLSDTVTSTALLHFIPRLLEVLRSSDNAILKHDAIVCVDQISEQFGKREPSAVLEAAEVVSGDFALGSSVVSLQTISVLCLVSMVEILRDDFVGLLPVIMPQAFKYLQESIKVADSGGDEYREEERLHNAIYALFTALLDQIPYIVSGEYLDELFKLNHLSAQAAMDETTEESRKGFYNLAASRLDAQECFSAILRNMDSAIQRGPDAFHEQIELLNITAGHHSKSTIQKNSSTLFNTILKAFDLRRLQSVDDALQKQFDSKGMDICEQRVSTTTIAITMKLNDSSFRPFFVRLVEWAEKGLPKSDITGRASRARSLFGFLEVFFQSLKSIVTGYSSYIIDLASAWIKEVELKDEDGLGLLTAILKTLTKSFEHDQDEFWQSPSHFTTVADPILNQLSQPLSSEFLSSTLIPTITALATAASSSGHYKTINSAVLQLLRHDTPAVRMAAVQTQVALVQKLGEDWASLLPEILPFLSEAMDDDDERVEREVARWKKVLEEVLGERVDGYLA